MTRKKEASKRRRAKLRAKSRAKNNPSDQAVADDERMNENACDRSDARGVSPPSAPLGPSGISNHGDTSGPSGVPSDSESIEPVDLVTPGGFVPSSNAGFLNLSENSNRDSTNASSKIPFDSESVEPEMIGQTSRFDASSSTSIGLTDTRLSSAEPQSVSRGAESSAPESKLPESNESKQDDKSQSDVGATDSPSPATGHPSEAVSRPTGFFYFRVNLSQWRENHAFWSQFFSGGDPLPTPEEIPGDAVLGNIGSTSFQVVADSARGNKFTWAFKFAKETLGPVRELRSLPWIVGRVFILGLGTGVVTLSFRILNPQQSPGFWYVGVIVVAAFVQQLLAYLRPQIPLLWAVATAAADSILILLTLVFAING